jgi:putative DNA primase/helicase
MVLNKKKENYMTDADFAQGKDAKEVKENASKPKKRTNKKPAYEKLANEYVAFLMSPENGQFTIFYNSKHYLFDGKKYCVNDEFKINLSKFFLQKGIDQSTRLLTEVESIIKGKCHLPTSQNPQMPFYNVFEGDKNDFFNNPQDIISFNNGLLNITNWTIDSVLQPHTAQWISTTCLPFDYSPLVECPLWLNFLNEIFEGDEARIKLLQEWFGYCLTTDTSLQKVLVQKGKARSGKSTCQEILQALLGVRNWTSFNLGDFIKDFGMAKLEHKMLACVPEIEITGNIHKNAISEKFKSVTGNDAQTINQKMEKERSVKLFAKFMLASNSLPHFHDPSGAISARLLFLDYQMSFMGREDFNLKNKLFGELSGIMNWALHGLIRLRANKNIFTMPESSKKMQKHFQHETASVKCFIIEKLIVNKTVDSGDLHGVEYSEEFLSISRDDVYKLFQEWCEDNDRNPIPRQYFYSHLRDALPKLIDIQRRINGKHVRLIIGIGKKTSIEKMPATFVTTSKMNSQNDISEADFIEGLKNMK